MVLTTTTTTQHLSSGLEDYIETIYVSQKHGKNSVKVTAFADLYAEKDEKTVITFKFNGEFREVKTFLKEGKNTVKTNNKSHLSHLVTC